MSLGGRSFEPPKVGDYKFKWTITANAAVGFIAIVGAVFGVIVSILGLFVQKCMNCCFAVPFGLLTFIAAIIALIFGAGIIGGTAATKVKDDICNAKIDGSTTTAGAFLKGHYDKYVDNVMCSDTCNCDPTNLGLWTSAIRARSPAKTNWNVGSSGTVKQFANDCL